MQTVKEYRRAGYKVRVLHLRKIITVVEPELLSVGEFRQQGASLSLLPQEISATGGATLLQIRTPEGREIQVRARCSDKDRYCKKVGVAVALERAKEILLN